MNGIEFECCNGTCNQGRNCPMREQRPVAGTGLVIAVAIVGTIVVIALCVWLVFR